ncbi:lysine--tRNA ligase [Hydrogenobacter hydrogenophilus]|uniref:Lysine--tRNA ligase n=1 Tax=Hydrogenobacter hydrogenophilus TaxID=35835 RepID=A0A285NMP7_9AQUI|nr:lysine--tRNA ligase [Hydrogenobacter hydrogenophilus]SNZ10735.1 lysyl-tRNA synthetase, class II [Hydrogenobacter hydrogenophilus]
MEQERLKKLEKIKEPYPHKFEVSHFIGEIRQMFEKDPTGEEVSVRGIVKRVSKIEDGFLVRLSDEEGVEILAITEHSLKQGEVYNLKGKLVRNEGKLTLESAEPSDSPTTTIKDIKITYDFDPNFYQISVAGRLVSLRSMGKAIFGHLQDATGRIQIYIKKDIVGDDKFQAFDDLFDVGDIVGVKGKLFRTNTGELTVEVNDFKMLAKSLRPLPEKWHGLKDVEVRYRQRYLDLISNERARKITILRSRLISEIRRFLDERGFIEVETPILQPVASGANAKPFITYHNYLEQNLYLRIAPELYLKRLIVGGFNRVYELGKNFRNEGVDTTHNPEFTMLEFYCAYWDYKDLIKFTEELFSHLLNRLLGTLKITYQGITLDFTPPYKVVRYFDLLKEKTGKDKEFFLRDIEGLRKLAIEIGVPKAETLTHAKLLDKVFDLLVEDELIGPVFVIDFPKILSPLAKTHREDTDLVERFELFVAGREIANAYTELNDPIEQRSRFLEQLKEKEMGDEEAMQMDEDFIIALEHGMPPTAGEGIGIDRLVMLLADVDSIREVILFPALRQR